MKTYTSKSAAKNQDTNIVWDAFVNYLEPIYFEGATEDLDQELVNFEESPPLPMIMSYVPKLPRNGRFNMVQWGFCLK